MSTRTLFPPFHPHTQWRAVDDRIRGGSSISHLDTTSNHAARFWGTLDITTLGGAGFASQCHTFEPRALRLCKDEYEGLAITFDVTARSEKVRGEEGKEKPKHFTLVLKGSVPPLRPDGRRESTLSYEYTFVNAASTSSSPESATMTTKQRTITIPWTDFSATYRGRPITPKDPQYTPLDPGSADSNGKEQGGVAELSLMCRSGFGKQEGEFELVVHRIEAVRVGGAAAAASAGMGGKESDDLEKQAWDEAVHKARPQGRFPAPCKSTYPEKLSAVQAQEENNHSSLVPNAGVAGLSGNERFHADPALAKYAYNDSQYYLEYDCDKTP